MGLYCDAWEDDGQPNITATGDDIANSHDEDGITFVTPLHPGRNARADVSILGTGKTGYINAWIDFNTDGDFDDAGERVANDFYVEYGSSNSIIFAVPTNATGRQYNRFRLTVNTGEVTTYTGAAPNGEVEDYAMGSIKGVVWDDSDGDGIQDAGEPGINGVTVRLLSCAGVELQTTVTGAGGPNDQSTDVNGYYEFGDLLPGCYQVAFDTPLGFVVSPRQQGGNPALDSDGLLTIR